MIKLSEGGFADMWRGTKSPEVEALSYALQQQVAAIVEASQKTSCYAGVDDLPEKVLDYFALELRAMYYDVTLPLSRKREIIKRTIAWYAQNGTAKSLVGMLSTAFDSASIEEWYEYNGEPFHFSVVLATEWDEATETAAREAISRAKNVRSVLDSLIFQVESSTAQASADTAVIGMEIIETSNIMQAASIAVDRVGTAVSGMEIVNGITVYSA